VRRTGWLRRHWALSPASTLLVNKAGMSIRGRFWEVNDDEWDEQVNVQG
jgi:short-subunit dehydrogenase